MLVPLASNKIPEIIINLGAYSGNLTKLIVEPPVPEGRYTVSASNTLGTITSGTFVKKSMSVADTAAQAIVPLASGEGGEASEDATRLIRKRVQREEFFIADEDDDDDHGDEVEYSGSEIFVQDAFGKHRKIAARPDEIGALMGEGDGSVGSFVTTSYTDTFSPIEIDTVPASPFSPPPFDQQQQKAIAGGKGAPPKTYSTTSSTTTTTKPPMPLPVESI